MSYKELYIVRCAIEEVSDKCSREVVRDLMLYEVRIANAANEADRFRDTPQLQNERLRAFHSFQQTFEAAGLHRYVSWDELKALAERQQEFDDMSIEKREDEYLRRIADFMEQQLRSVDADDAMFVPLYAIFLPYGETKSDRDPPKRSRHTRLVERIVDSHDSILVIRGMPGTGKSVAMRQVMLKLVKRSIGSRRRVIPVFIPLGQVGSSNSVSSEGSDWVIQQIREYLNRGSFENRDLKRSVRFISQQLESLLREGRCVVIFDGMDELPRDGYDDMCRMLVQFARQWADGKSKTNRFFFSCRTFDYPGELRLHNLVLLPFNWEDVERYLKSHLPEERFKERRNEVRNLWQGETGKALLDNPFFLHLATRHMSEHPGEDLPSNKGLLFDAYVERIFRIDSQHREDVNRKHEKIARLLEDLALWITDRKKSGTTATWSDLEGSHEGQQIEQTIRECQRGGKILSYFIDIKADGITFRHHRLREFFAARAIKRKFFLNV